MIGDAGGTKTAWRLIHDDGVESYSSVGFNAFTHSLNDFRESIQRTNEILKADEVHIYCAGADTDEQKEQIANDLAKVFSVKPAVENDLLGAARATCQRSKGYICILGTGANASYYNGSNVEKVSASLGYIMGDEGSGAYLGKRFLRSVYRGWFDTMITSRFQDQFKLPVDKAISELYNADHPNKYLASFVPFIADLQHEPQVSQLIQDSFRDFFIGFFKNQKVEEPLHFVGSIAFHFSEFLNQVANDLNYQLGNIVKSPMDGLVSFHQHEQ